MIGSRPSHDGAQELTIEIGKTMHLSGFGNTSMCLGVKQYKSEMEEEGLFKSSEREERRGHVVKCYIYKRVHKGVLR